MVAILDAFLIVEHLPIKSEVLQLQVWSVWSAYTMHPSGPTSAVCLALLKLLAWRCPSGGFRDFLKAMSWTVPARTQPGHCGTCWCRSSRDARHPG